MINIDTVYQRVLAIANKEQRGYITPQEFNLFANQAQMEIFEQYFYDINQMARIPGNEYVYADVDDMLEEKIQVFESTDNAQQINLYVDSNITIQGIPIVAKTIPSHIYRIHRIELDRKECEIMKTKDFQQARLSGGPLIKPTTSRPIANIRNNTIRCVGENGTFVIPTTIHYFRKPHNVSWGYVVIADKALYDQDPNKTKHFELHPSEEIKLIYKILKLAGIAMRRDDIMKAGQGSEMLQIQQEKQ